MMETMQQRQTARYALLDELRGFTILNMVAYHAIWDMVWLFDIQAVWYSAWPGKLWQQAICWTFILLSGFCVPLGRHPFRRGLLVFGAGALVSAVTCLFMPEERVLFGVLTFLGSAMLLTAVLQPWLQKWDPTVGLALNILLFCISYPIQRGVWKPEMLWLPKANLFTAFLGFYPDGFFSADYFPLLPWLFLFWTGYCLQRLLAGRGVLEPLRSVHSLALAWLGRHSLLIYLLHQPVIYAALSVLFG